MKVKMIFSAMPPKSAAIHPMSAERIDTPRETVTAMMSDRPRPWIVWAKRSFPESEVPNQCSALGAEARWRKSGSS